MSFWDVFAFFQPRFLLLLFVLFFSRQALDGGVYPLEMGFGGAGCSGDVIIEGFGECSVEPVQDLLHCCRLWVGEENVCKREKVNICVWPPLAA